MQGRSFGLFYEGVRIWNFTVYETFCGNYQHDKSKRNTRSHISRPSNGIWQSMALRPTLQAPKTEPLTQLVVIIRFFLENISFSVRVGDNLSTPRDIIAGVPQGSGLFPLLFIFFINDMPSNSATHLNCGLHNAVFIEHKHKPCSKEITNSPKYNPPMAKRMKTFTKHRQDGSYQIQKTLKKSHSSWNRWWIDPMAEYLSITLFPFLV